MLNYDSTVKEHTCRLRYAQSATKLLSSVVYVDRSFLV